MIKPTVFFVCLWARERGGELVYGVSLKDETSEKRNFKQPDRRQNGQKHGTGMELDCPESFRKRTPVIYLRGGVGLAT